MRATYQFRVERQGKRKVIEIQPPRVQPKAHPNVHPVALRLALAYHVERSIDAGVVTDFAEAARRLGITRARMSQILDLMLLPVAAQERILLGDLRPSKTQVRELIASLLSPPA